MNVEVREIAKEALPITPSSIVAPVVRELRQLKSKLDLEMTEFESHKSNTLKTKNSLSIYL